MGERVRRLHLGSRRAWWLGLPIALLVAAGSVVAATRWPSGPSPGRPPPGTTTTVEPLVPRAILLGGTGLPDVERTVWHAGVPAVADVLVGAVSGQVKNDMGVDPGIAAAPYRDKVVELSFDDGPDPRWTPQILAILQREGIHATFSLIGYQVLRYGAIARQELALGETICDHTAHHNERLDRAPHDVVAMEIDLGADIIERATGQHPVCYRPPGGALSPDVVATAHARGMRVLDFSVDPSDYRRPPAAVIVGRVLAAVRPGSVILLHDGGGDRSQTVAALPRLIDALKAEGYRTTTMQDEPPA
jgi:peptidoglycan/xylan/chitin deacetylase (PgdA/CDA1 family)